MQHNLIVLIIYLYRKNALMEWNLNRRELIKRAETIWIQQLHSIQLFFFYIYRTRLIELCQQC